MTARDAYGQGRTAALRMLKVAAPAPAPTPAPAAPAAPHPQSPPPMGPAINPYVQLALGAGVPIAAPFAINALMSPSQPPQVEEPR